MKRYKPLEQNPELPQDAITWLQARVLLGEHLKESRLRALGSLVTGPDAPAGMSLYLYTQPMSSAELYPDHTSFDRTEAQRTEGETPDWYIHLNEYR